MLKSVKNFAFASKRRRIVSVLALLLLTASAAIAALILYTGVSGSGSAHVQNSSTLGALTVTGTNNPELVAGGNATAHYNIVNNDPDAVHQITGTPTAVITSNPSNCASFITWAGSGLEGIIVPAGGTNSGDVTVSLSAAVPISCAGATVSFAISGTTTP
jgi:hypothetical protein